ncbi:MFS transporter [Naumannella halotolerans]|uniref:MFS transporter n=1 Tax=Naumannella halotolerans TaxID=993414 RepID=UPI00370D3D19
MSTIPAAPSKQTQLRRVVAASMAGTIVEWYEFFLYASAATLVFSHIFFPESDNPLVNVMYALGTYAVGFIARPLGGIVFGHFGDKYGRKKLLQLSIILVGAATFLMGCIPSYDTIGPLAIGILIFLRLLQGFAVGGEWGGAVLLVAEHSPKEQRGFWASWPQSAVPLGNLLATAVLFILSATLTSEQFLAWGWRIAFWLSVVIVIVGYYIRTKVNDAPIFEAAKAEIQEGGAGYGAIEVFKRFPRGVFTAMGLRLLENVFYYLLVTFTITYLTFSVDLGQSDVLGLLLVGHIFHAIAVPLIGKLTDRIGRKPVYAVGTVLAATWGFWAYRLYDTGQDLYIGIALVAGLLFHGLMYAGQPAIMAEMFPTRMRYSGVSIGYQLTAIVAGSLAPIIATALLNRYESSTPIAVYLLICGVITMIAVIAYRETKGLDLHELDKADDDYRADLRAKQQDAL